VATRRDARRELLRRNGAGILWPVVGAAASADSFSLTTYLVPLRLSGLHLLRERASWLVNLALLGGGSWRGRLGKVS